MRLFLRRGLTTHDYSFWRNHRHPGATTGTLAQPPRSAQRTLGTQDSGELRTQCDGEVEFRRIEAVLRQQLRPAAVRTDAGLHVVHTHFGEPARLQLEIVPCARHLGRRVFQRLEIEPAQQFRGTLGLRAVALHNHQRHPVTLHSRPAAIVVVAVLLRFDLAFAHLAH